MEEIKKSRRKKRWIISICTIGIILCLGVSGWLVWAYEQHPQQITKVKKTEHRIKSKIKSASKGTSQVKAASESKDVPKEKPKTKRAPTNHNEAADSWTFKVEQVREDMKGPVNPDKPKVVFLTFDDGPSSNDTPQVLNILAEHNVHATFFLVGNRITPETQALVQQEYDSGHGIAVHSFTHDYKILYPNNVPNAQAILDEANKTRDLMKSFLGDKFDTRVWRYPGGTMSWKNLDESKSLLEKDNFTWMDWNAADGDGLGASAPKTVQAALNYHAMSLTVYPQSNVEIILMHDASDKQVTVQALPEIIKYYKDRDYQFGILE
ncbi:polysaccharide deacetylase family protein [Xylocopilactobacillus apicola]|uniref:Polysaccharide deacetylase n=1 Tax=Xylocopilactobacillus apicola TaxID=2932184 RepID=A0AAU9DYL2_9LACO|nr:polysaccharide deacetylase family protein [Xylocopilactobacillus apicola]BDR59283.1 polysaccharide deacetylase [Xylocopilactobacillus apicola]